MTATAIPRDATIRARQAGFLADLMSVAMRAIRQIPRDPEAVIPALVVPIFFYVVNTGSLAPLLDMQLVGTGLDGYSFQLPVAIIFAVTGISRASALVMDIQDGYFDRLLMTPIKRLALLLGLMIADFVLVVSLTIPVLIMGFITGVRFETGIPGLVVFVLLSALWGLVFTGFPYAIALKTGNPAAVNSSFVLFFPFAFLTTAFVPEEDLTGWLQTVAKFNPVTYLLAGLRSLVVGWDASALGQAVLAIALIGIISIGLALLALRGRVRSS